MARIRTKLDLRSRRWKCFNPSMDRRVASFAVLFALGLAGCTTTMTTFPESHPASPGAAQAADAAPPPFLMAGTNLFTAPPSPATPSEHEHKHNPGNRTEEKK